MLFRCDNSSKNLCAHVSARVVDVLVKLAFLSCVIFHIPAGICTFSHAHTKRRLFGRSAAFAANRWNMDQMTESRTHVKSIIQHLVHVTQATAF